MHSFRINRTDSGLFSKQGLDLVYHQDQLKEFLNQPFSIEQFAEQSRSKLNSYSSNTRKILCDVLEKQYTKRGTTDLGDCINRLRSDKSLSVACGHQLVVFGGPLYLVLKIIHVVKLSRILKKKYPEFDFVPVFWMATEDHDFEEVQHVHLFGNNRTWEAKEGIGGAVGRMPADSLVEFRQQLHQLFERHPDSAIHTLIDSFDGDCYSLAFSSFLHTLFGNEGLLIIDGDDPELKQLMAPLVEKELNEEFSNKAILETNERLIQSGYHLQMHPREINLFYLGDGKRNRIIRDGDQYDVGTEKRYSKVELLSMLASHPEFFSPNVALRPLYQEMILPNTCYVGGTGEISYWLQLKGVFDELGVLFPLLQIRNSLFWINAQLYSKMEKYGLIKEDLFLPEDELKKNFVLKQESETLNFNELDRILEKLNQEIARLCDAGDSSLQRFKEAEQTRLQNQIDQLKSKLIKSEKSQHEEAMKAISFVHSKLFPNGVLQERVESVFNFCPDGSYQRVLKSLFEVIDPEQNDLILLFDAD